MNKTQQAISNLQETHERMCEKVLDIMKNPDATLQELKFVKDFLHDNKIEAIPIAGSPMGAVVQTAQDKNIIKLPTHFPSGDLLEDDDPEVCSG